MSKKKVRIPLFVTMASRLLFQMFKLERVGLPLDIDWRKTSVTQSQLDEKGVGELHNIEFHWPGLRMITHAYVWANGSVEMSALEIEMRRSNPPPGKTLRDDVRLHALFRSKGASYQDQMIAHGPQSKKVRERYPREATPPSITELRLSARQVQDLVCPWDIYDATSASH